MTINQEQVQHHKRHNSSAATEAVRDGHYNKASRILRQALAETHCGGECDPALLIEARAVADYYFQSGNYSHAATLYRNILDAKIKDLGAEHDDVRDTRKRLALSLWHTGGISPELLDSCLV